MKRIVIILFLAMVAGCAATKEPASHRTLQQLEEKKRCKVPNYWDDRFKECKPGRTIWNLM